MRKKDVLSVFVIIIMFLFVQIYPSDNHPQLSTFTQKFAYVKFEDQKSVEVAQHLTNTVFIDRALVCIPSISGSVHILRRFDRKDSVVGSHKNRKLNFLLWSVIVYPADMFPKNDIFMQMVGTCTLGHCRVAN